MRERERLKERGREGPGGISMPAYIVKIIASCQLYFMARIHIMHVTNAHRWRVSVGEFTSQ